MKKQFVTDGNGLGKMNKVLLSFRCICDVEFGIIDYILSNRESYSKIFDFSDIPDNVKRAVILYKLRYRKNPNPLSILKKINNDFDIDELLNLLLKNNYKNILNEAVFTEIGYLPILESKSRLEGVKFYIWCRNEDEKNHISNIEYFKDKEYVISESILDTDIDFDIYILDSFKDIINEKNDINKILNLKNKNFYIIPTEYILQEENILVEIEFDKQNSIGFMEKWIFNNKK